MVLNVYTFGAFCGLITWVIFANIINMFLFGLTYFNDEICRMVDFKKHPEGFEID